MTLKEPKSIRKIYVKMRKVTFKLRSFCAIWLSGILFRGCVLEFSWKGGILCLTNPMTIYNPIHNVYQIVDFSWV